MIGEQVPRVDPLLKQGQVRRVQVNGERGVGVEFGGHVANHRLDREATRGHLLVHQSRRDRGGDLDGGLLQVVHLQLANSAALFDRGRHLLQRPAKALELFAVAVFHRLQFGEALVWSGHGGSLAGWRASGPK